jgi:hypothetical protein
MGKRAEGIGIALKKQEVFLLIGRKFIFKTRFICAGKPPEKYPDSFFPAVAEGRVANIVRKTGGGYYIGQFVAIKLRKTFIAVTILFGELISHRLTKRAAHRCHFEAMGKPVVHKYRAGQRKNLRFVLQPAESGRKNDTVVIPYKRSAGGFSWTISFWL